MNLVQLHMQKKIVTTTFKVLEYIAHNPQIGTASNIKRIKNKSILNRFSLIYKVDEKANKILVLRYWDNRRNPQN